MLTPLFVSRPKIEINVKLLATGENFTLEVSPSGNILEIKRKIQKERGILVEDQTVIFAGKPRIDERRFKDCGIQVGSYISILVKPRAPQQCLSPPRPTLSEKTRAILKLRNKIKNRSASYSPADGTKEPGVED